MVTPSKTRRSLAALTLIATATTLALTFGILVSEPAPDLGWACAAADCSGKGTTSRLPDSDEVMQAWAAARSL